MKKLDLDSLTRTLSILPTALNQSSLETSRLKVKITTLELPYGRMTRMPMEKNLIVSRSQEKKKTECHEHEWSPKIRYDKTLDETFTSVYCQVCSINYKENLDMEIPFVPNPPKIDTREKLNSVARLVEYMYESKREEYESLASDKRKDHIFNDLQAVSRWLNDQYRTLNKKEIEDVITKQDKGKHIRT